MTAKEFYRKRFIELSNDGIMKKLAKHVDIEMQSKICQEYAEYYEREKYNKKVECGNCGADVVMNYTTESFCPNCLY